MADDKSKAAPEDALFDQERLAEAVRRVGHPIAAVEAFRKR
jgi:hypothetical protein